MIDNTDNYFDDDTLESVERFESMLKTNKPCYFDVHEFENLVDHYLENRKLAKANEACEMAIEQHPTSISLQLKQAQVLISRGEEIKALTILRKLKKIESTNHNIYILIGNIYNILKKPHNAKIQFDIALELCYDEREDLLFKIA
ncbi:MAG: putative Zn-dependent protease, partial [Ancylomarina sp.]